MKPAAESAESTSRPEPLESALEQPVTIETQPDATTADLAKSDVAAEFWRLARAIDIPEDGYIRNTGVGLRENEIEALDEIAKRLGLGRNSLIRFAVRTLLQLNEAGLLALESVDVQPQRRTRKKIRITNR
jgi:hypothetical protein